MVDDGTGYSPAVPCTFLTKSDPTIALNRALRYHELNKLMSLFLRIFNPRLLRADFVIGIEKRARSA